jgi:4-hydroxybenzoyl-CoA reductase subunit alpha
MPEYAVLGKRLPREESIPKVTGEAKYTLDITLPGMLHGKLLTSPYAHARIVNIDTSKAMRLRGVKAVVTAKDVPDRRKFPVIGPPIPTDQGLLARGKVRHLGEAVAAVAAIDEDTAEEALDLIQVEYEVLPSLFDAEEAMKPGAVRVHDELENNVPTISTNEYGDVEQGFRESAYVREDTFRFHQITYVYPEPTSTIASFDPISGRITVWASTQDPYNMRKQLGHLLDIPWTRVRVICPYVGGGYGGRLSICSANFCAAALSLRTGRPVRIINTREEDFVSEWAARHNTIVKIKTGVKRDGTFVARDITAIYDVGAYRVGIKGPTPQAYVAGQHVPYKIPHFKSKGIAVYTTKQPVGPYRGYGQYPTLWAAELQMDVIARELGIDPLKMRMANGYGPDTLTPFEWVIGTCGLKESMEKVSQAIEWRGPDEPRLAGRGKGIGTSWFSSGPAGGSPENPVAAQVRVNENGTADMIVVATDSGSGQYSALRMIVAEELSIPLDKVGRLVADSDLFPNELGATSVTITSFGGPVKIASEKARQIILEAAADKMEANADDLECEGGRVFVKGSPDKGMSFGEAAKIAVTKNNGPIVCRGETMLAGFAKHGPEWVVQRFMRFSHPGTSMGLSFGAAGVEVEVDKETGKVRILRAAHAYDVGFAVNPMEVEGQLQGGAVSALGGLTTEELVFDNGQILNPSYLNYGMLSAADVPSVTPFIVEEHDSERDGPYGTKELGMGCSCAAGGAVINAIYNATGVLLTEFPVTPERLLKALDAQKAEKE